MSASHARRFCRIQPGSNRGRRAVQPGPILAAVACNGPHVLQVSSVCVYAPGYNAPCHEDNGHAGEPVGANNGYAWAKRMGERVVQWLPDLDHRVVIVRPSNIYGPRDYVDEKAHVIPALIRKVCTSPTIPTTPILVHGTGDEQREFIYVTDVVDGMLYALAHGEHRGIYNLGSRYVVSIRDLLSAIQGLCATRYRVQYQDGDAGDNRRWSDTTRMDDLGWTAPTRLTDGLQETIAWYRSTL